MEYLNIADIFFPDSKIEFIEFTDINNYFINLIKRQQPPVG